MQKTLKAAVIALALTGGAFATAGTANAEISISFNPGIVAYGYDDGYWDHNRRWHAWQHPGHRDTFRRTYSTRYYTGVHTRYRDYGWRGPAQPVVTFNIGNVLFGYDDGYWDRNRQWHTWQHSSHRDMYRNSPGNQFRIGRHVNHPNQGWRDNDNRNDRNDRNDRRNDRNDRSDRNDRNDNNGRNDRR